VPVLRLLAERGAVEMLVRVALTVGARRLVLGRNRDLLRVDGSCCRSRWPPVGSRGPPPCWRQLRKAAENIVSGGTDTVVTPRLCRTRMSSRVVEPVWAGRSGGPEV
jgi:hypothetical protein